MVKIPGTSPESIHLAEDRQKFRDTIEKFTVKIATMLNVIGLINIQYAIMGDKVYILEATSMKLPIEGNCLISVDDSDTLTSPFS